MKYIHHFISSTTKVTSIIKHFYIVSFNITGYSKKTKSWKRAKTCSIRRSKKLRRL